MGTPHRGADLASSLSKLLMMVFSRKVFVNELQNDCETVVEINRFFRSRAEAMEIVSFFETRGIRALGVHLPLNYI